MQANIRESLKIIVETKTSNKESQTAENRAGEENSNRRVKKKTHEQGKFSWPVTISWACVEDVEHH